MKKLALVACAAALGLGVVGCSSNADVVSENLSKAADNFEIARRVIFIDTFTNEYLLSIEGRCNINVDQDGGGQLEVTCRTPEGDKKHFLGLGVGATYFVEQLNPAQVSQDHYKVYFKPSVIIPDIDAK
jgi:hypothetical protein